jgi:predicted metal-dependent phosphotriesterase family hydrolase
MSVGYSSNFDDTLELTAPAGGAAVGTPIYNSTSKLVSYPMTAATSGNLYTGKVNGMIKSARKLSGVAWVAGQALRFVSSTSKWAKTTINTHVTQGTAAADATSADIYGDVILRFPSAGNI